MVFNATFNNISVISWQSVLLVEATGIPRENHRPTAIHWQTLSHNVVSSTARHVVICTDCTGSCKSNNHTITTGATSRERTAYHSGTYEVTPVFVGGIGVVQSVGFCVVPALNSRYMLVKIILISLMKLSFYNELCEE